MNDRHFDKVGILLNEMVLVFTSTVCIRTGKLREFYLPRPILLTIHPESREGCFVGKDGRGNPWLSKNFNFPKK